MALSCKRMEQAGLKCDCSSLRCVILGAEPTQLDTIVRASEAWSAPRDVFRNSYGLAEHCVMIFVDGTRVSAGSLSFSEAMGVDVRIAVEEEGGGGWLVEQEQEAEGEICVRSRSTALGYWQKPEVRSTASLRARCAMFVTNVVHAARRQSGRSRRRFEGWRKEAAFCGPGTWGM